MSDDLVKRLWLHDCEGITREAADRIEELKRILSSSPCEIAAHSNRLTEYMFHWEGRALDAEAKLAKAVEALGEAWFMLTVPHLDYEPEPEEPGLRRIKTTLAELEGERQVAIDAAKRIEELEAALEWLIAGAETVLEEWDRGDEAAFREAIEEMRADVEEAKGTTHEH